MIRWRADGAEVFYVGGQNGKLLHAVQVSLSPESAVLGKPEPLFEMGNARYDASPDGQRFLISEPPTERLEPAIRVVQNWCEEFRSREQD